MELGNRITKLRKKEKMSQEVLADLVGVTRQTISNWELNATKPDVAQIKKLSKIFNISIDELLDNDVRDIVEKKISNTEKISNKTAKTMKILCITIYFIILSLLIGIIFYYCTKKDFTNDYQPIIVCTLEKDAKSKLTHFSHYNDETFYSPGIYYLYWTLLDDGTYSMMMEYSYPDKHSHRDYGEHKGFWGDMIFEELKTGASLIDSVEAVKYYKERLLLDGATCR